MRLLKRFIATASALGLCLLSTLPAYAALPTVVTTPINMGNVDLISLTSPKALLFGQVTNEGGLTVDSVGFVYGTTSLGDPGNIDPATTAYDASDMQTWSAGLGSFNTYAAYLTPGGTYYFRAVAHNSDGWKYGSEETFTIWNQKLWYQPNAVITSTTMPDRGTGAHVGSITWGSNPAGLSTSYGSLVPTIPLPTPVNPYHPGDIVNPAQPAPTPNPSTLTSSPLYPIVHLIANGTGFTGKDIVIWRILGAMLVFGLIIVAWMAVPQHLLLTGIVGLVGTVFLVSQSIYPWWTILLASVYLFTTLLSERSPSI